MSKSRDTPVDSKRPTHIHTRVWGQTNRETVYRIKENAINQTVKKEKTPTKVLNVKGSF